MAFPSLVPVQKVPSPTSHSNCPSSSLVQVCSQTFSRYDSRFVKVQPPLLQLTLQPRQRMLPQLSQLPSTCSHSRRSHYRHLQQVVSNRRCLQKLRCWCLHSQDIWSHDATLCQVGFHKVLSCRFLQDNERQSMHRIGQRFPNYRNQRVKRSRYTILPSRTFHHSSQGGVFTPTTTKNHST